ncbi:MAG: sugar phosphate nucleotidyltransferase [Candidatus Omnitrophota bacterium]
MKAVILAGGEGTRLRPLTFAIPKPLIPVGERPILEVIVKRLKKFGFRNFIFSVGYKAELIRTYFQHGRNFGVKIDYIHEDKPLGTAGSLKLAVEKFHFKKDEPFLLMNGDILTRLDFKKMARSHLKSKAVLTVGVKEYSQRLPFGSLEIKGDTIKGIIEKPVISRHISTGIYMIDPSCLKNIPRNKFFTMPMLITAVLKENMKVKPYFIKEDWLAVEHLQHLEEVNCDLERWVK